MRQVLEMPNNTDDADEYIRVLWEEIANRREEDRIVDGKLAEWIEQNFKYPLAKTILILLEYHPNPSKQDALKWLRTHFGPAIKRSFLKGKELHEYLSLEQWKDLVNAIFRVVENEHRKSVPKNLSEAWLAFYQSDEVEYL